MTSVRSDDVWGAVNRHRSTEGLQGSHVARSPSAFAKAPADGRSFSGGWSGLPRWPALREADNQLFHAQKGRQDQDMTSRPSLRLSTLIAAVFILALAPLVAQTIELDAATIADINAAFDAGTLTAEQLVQR